jgi:hypothetical protein
MTDMRDTNDPVTRSRRAPAEPPYEVAENDPRIEPLVPEIARRLRALCATMPPEEFDRLVRSIARTRLRWP